MKPSKSSTVVHLLTSHGFGWLVNFDLGQSEESIVRGVQLSDGWYRVELTIHA